VLLPFVSSSRLGQPDGLFALAAAVAWRRPRLTFRRGRRRERWIAAKLLAWR